MGPLPLQEYYELIDAHFEVSVLPLYLVLLLGGGGWGFHIKVTGVTVGNFERTSERYQNSVLWVWSEQFLPLRGTVKLTRREAISNGNRAEWRGSPICLSRV